MKETCDTAASPEPGAPIVQAITASDPNVTTEDAPPAAEAIRFSLAHRVRRSRVALLSVALLAACSATPSTGPALTPAAPTATAALTSAPTVLPTATPPSPSPQLRLPGQAWEANYLTFEPRGLAGFKGFSGLISTHLGFIGWGSRATGSELMIEANGADPSKGWSGGGLFEGVTLDAMADGPTGIVALGVDAHGATRAWRSTDGASWGEPIDPGIDGRVRALVSFNGLYVAAGPARTGCDLRVWLSSDGLAWRTSGSLPGAVGTCTTGATPARPTIDLVRITTGELAALGSVPGLGQVVWTSGDGAAWQIHTLSGLGGHIAGLTAGGPGYVAVGTSGLSTASAWTSVDGATWVRAPDAADLVGAAMVDAATLGDGTLVAIGGVRDAAGKPGTFLAWTSTDGLTWHRATEYLCDFRQWDCPLPARPNRLAASGDLLLAVSGLIAWESPASPSLHAATLTAEHAGATFAAVGQCSDTTDQVSDTPLGGMEIFGRWVEPGDASQGGGYATFGGGARRIDLTIAPDGHVLRFHFEDPVGRTFDYDASVGGTAVITALPGSSPSAGTVTFEVVVRMDPATGAPDLGSKSISGSLTWTCRP